MACSKNLWFSRNCVAKFDDKKGGDAGDKWKQGKPIRVLRGYKGRKHSKYAPEEGCRLVQHLKYLINESKLGWEISAVLGKLSSKKIKISHFQI